MSTEILRHVSNSPALRKEKETLLRRPAEILQASPLLKETEKEISPRARRILNVLLLLLPAVGLSYLLLFWLSFSLAR